MNNDILVSPCTNLQNAEMQNVLIWTEIDLELVIILKQTTMNQQSRVLEVNVKSKTSKYTEIHSLGIWCFRKLAPREKQECIT